MYPFNGVTHLMVWLIFYELKWNSCDPSKHIIHNSSVLHVQEMSTCQPDEIERKIEGKIM